MVFCYTDEQVERMSEEAVAYTNLCVMGPKKMIVSGTQREWIYDDSSDKDEGHHLYWEESTEDFKLGNFRFLIEFLIENSGRRTMIEEIANAK